MKVIELLTKIANGEIEDKRTFNIRFKNGLYRSIYYDKEEENCMCCLKNVSDDYSIYDDISFDDEIEIIEEQKEETKTTTRESFEALGYACGEIQKCFINGWNKSLKNEPLIEEDKKIEKIETYDEDGNIFIDEQCFEYVPIDKHCLTANEQVFVDKINEIIDYINKEDK